MRLSVIVLLLYIIGRQIKSPKHRPRGQMHDDSTDHCDDTFADGESSSECNEENGKGITIDREKKQCIIAYKDEYYYKRNKILNQNLTFP